MGSMDCDVAKHGGKASRRVVSAQTNNRKERNIETHFQTPRDSFKHRFVHLCRAAVGSGADW